MFAIQDLAEIAVALRKGSPSFPDRYLDFPGILRYTKDRYNIVTVAADASQWLLDFEIEIKGRNTPGWVRVFARLEPCPRLRLHTVSSFLPSARTCCRTERIPMGEDVDVICERDLEPGIMVEIRKQFPDEEFDIKMTHDFGNNSGFEGIIKNEPGDWVPHFTIALDKPRNIHVFFWGWDDRVIDPVLTYLMQNGIPFVVEDS